MENGGGETPRCRIDPLRFDADAERANGRALLGENRDDVGRRAGRNGREQRVEGARRGLRIPVDVNLRTPGAVRLELTRADPLDLDPGVRQELCVIVRHASTLTLAESAPGQ